MNSFLKKTAKIELVDREMIAAHRIPGATGKIRPVIVKMLNTLVKSRNTTVLKDFMKCPNP